MKYRPKGSSYVQGECFMYGCNYKQRPKGKNRRGIKTYDFLCDYHHRLKYKIKNPGEASTKMKWVKSIPNDECCLCGWNKAPCDRHRMVKEKGYTLDNIRILCPNCHRLVTYGIIKL